jgi:diadenosine tetraphosphate (Ap4A) HIT family hydrolase
VAGSTLEYKCVDCSFSLYLPIVELDVSVLGFYDDARFPGRCIVVMKKHYEDLTDVPDDLAARFISDATAAGAAIRGVTDAARMNYAVLGNVEHHVHCHVIPRARVGDANPTRPPWEHPQPVSHLPTDQTARLMERIAAALDETGSMRR